MFVFCFREVDGLNVSLIRTQVLVHFEVYDFADGVGYAATYEGFLHHIVVTRIGDRDGRPVYALVGYLLEVLAVYAVVVACTYLFRLRLSVSLLVFVWVCVRQRASCIVMPRSREGGDEGGIGLELCLVVDGLALGVDLRVVDAGTEEGSLVNIIFEIVKAIVRLLVIGVLSIPRLIAVVLRLVAVAVAAEVGEGGVYEQVEAVVVVVERGTVGFAQAAPRLYQVVGLALFEHLAAIESAVGAVPGIVKVVVKVVAGLCLVP